MARRKADAALAANPLTQDDNDILSRTFFAPQSQRPALKVQKPKPEHYKICCISLYNEDIDLLDEMVAELKRRGHTKANKSMVIRYALAQVNLDDIPKGY